MSVELPVVAVISGQSFQEVYDLLKKEFGYNCHTSHLLVEVSEHNLEADLSAPWCKWEREKRRKLLKAKMVVKTTIVGGSTSYWYSRV